MGESGMFVCVFAFFLSECDGIRHAKERHEKGEREKNPKNKRMNCKTSFALAPSTGKEKGEEKKNI
jgi:hypothetical protein